MKPVYDDFFPRRSMEKVCGRQQFVNLITLYRNAPVKATGMERYWSRGTNPAKPYRSMIEKMRLLRRKNCLAVTPHSLYFRRLLISTQCLCEGVVSPNLGISELQAIPFLTNQEKMRLLQGTERLSQRSLGGCHCETRT